MRLTLIIAGASTAVLLTLGCSSGKTVKKAEARTLPQTEPVAASKDTLVQAKKDDLMPNELDQVNKILKELEDIPFDFDSYVIPTQGLDIIRNDISMLNDMLAARGKFIRIIIEGHTDERGAEEYNLALGERRAKTVRDYMLNAGFKAGSLKIISYGEERPKVEGNTTEAWTANRRVHLILE